MLNFLHEKNRVKNIQAGIVRVGVVPTVEIIQVRVVRLELSGWEFFEWNFPISMEYIENLVIMMK